jgi:hypothetical protein
MIHVLNHSTRSARIVAFSALALLPAVVHLFRHSMPATHPLLAAGPLLAGFVLAARFSHTRVGLMGLGTTVAGLIWTANWLMMAGSGCCSTMN